MLFKIYLTLIPIILVIGYNVIYFRNHNGSVQQTDIGEINAMLWAFAICWPLLIGVACLYGIFTLISHCLMYGVTVPARLLLRRTAQRKISVDK